MPGETFNPARPDVSADGPKLVYRLGCIGGFSLSLKWTLLSALTLMLSGISPGSTYYLRPEDMIEP